MQYIAFSLLWSAYDDQIHGMQRNKGRAYFGSHFKGQGPLSPWWRKHGRTTPGTESCVLVRNSHTRFSFLRIHFILFPMCVGCLYGCVYTCMQITTAARRGCHLELEFQLWATWYGCWELSSGPWEEQQVLLITELFLQPLFSPFYLALDPSPHSGWVFPLQLSLSGDPLIDKVWAVPWCFLSPIKWQSRWTVRHSAMVGITGKTGAKAWWEQSIWMKIEHLTYWWVVVVVVFKVLIQW